MADEKTYIINLRRAFLRAPIYKRSKRSINEVRYFMQQHLKTKDVRIGPELNLKIWEKGRKNPPSKIQVKAIVKDGISYVELPGFEFPKAKVEKVKTEKMKVKAEKSDEKEINAKKEQQKELNKELSKEEELIHKKEHENTILKPTTSKTKLKEQLAEKSEAQGRIIGETGRKGKK